MIATRPATVPWVPLPWGPTAVLLGIVVCAAVGAPVATYAVTLALFGLPHVITELDYLRRRFGPWLGRWWWGLLAALLLVPAVRIASLSGLASSAWARPLELGAGVLLIAAIAPVWLRGPVRSRIGGLGLATLLVAGLLWSPLHALLAVAVLHNWTPVVLVTEAVDSSDRVRVGLLGAAVFGGLPLLVASGAAAGLLAGIGGGATEWSPIDAGSLARNLGAYLPPELWGWSSAANLFSAVVLAQCLHYAAVLLVLPRLAGRMPQRAWVAMLGLTALLFALYTLDFHTARSFYGVAASVHAWIEVPLMVLCLLPGADPAARR